MEVRKASLNDLHWIASELKDFNSDYLANDSLYPSEEYSAKFLTDLINNHLFLIAEDEGAPVGFVSGLITKHVYNPEITQVVELFWWVPKKYRSLGVGSLLLDAYTEWGKNNVNWTVFSFPPETEYNLERLSSLGYKKLETNYFIERY